MSRARLLTLIDTTALNCLSWVCLKRIVPSLITRRKHERACSTKGEIISRRLRCSESLKDVRSYEPDNYICGCQLIEKRQFVVSLNDRNYYAYTARQTFTSKEKEEALLSKSRLSIFQAQPKRLLNAPKSWYQFVASADDIDGLMIRVCGGDRD